MLVKGAKGEVHVPLPLIAGVITYPWLNPDKADLC